MSFQTEFEFTLPGGYVDKDGNLHRDGIMRKANARDEILPLQDPRVKSNPAYLTIILLSRVVTRLGALQQINPGVIEGMFVEDLSFLQNFYNQINGNGGPVQTVVCPDCEKKFDVEIGAQGES